MFLHFLSLLRAVFPLYDRLIEKDKANEEYESFLCNDSDGGSWNADIMQYRWRKRLCW